MSRGPGVIERAIARAFEVEPDNAFTTHDLIDRAYPGIAVVEKKHHVATLRAAKTFMSKKTEFAMIHCRGVGSAVVMFNRFNLLSYAMAQQKASGSPRYRRRESGGQPTLPPDVCESELRRQLQPGGCKHCFVEEGGDWWLQVEDWRGERIRAHR